MQIDGRPLSRRQIWTHWLVYPGHTLPTALTRKLRLIDETAHALTDIMDTTRSARLEATIVLLIVVELLVAFYQVFGPATH